MRRRKYCETKTPEKTIRATDSYQHEFNYWPGVYICIYKVGPFPWLSVMSRFSDLKGCGFGFWSDIIVLSLIHYLTHNHKRLVLGCSLESYGII